MKRESLRKTLEFESSDRNEQVQRAFATALEMQQKSADEAAALKAKLALTERKRQEDIEALTEQVGRRGCTNACNSAKALRIFLPYAGKVQTRKSSDRAGDQIF